MYDEASADDLVQIFSDTVVMYQKKPVYISRVTGDKTLRIYDLNDLSTEIGEIPVTSPDFDFTPVPLGFCNYSKDALYLQRIPKRQYKQGLCKANVVVTGITADVSKAAISALASVKNRSLAHCIEGKYPSLATAISMVVKEGCRSVAFNRKLAIDADLSLYYKEKRVGMVDEETGKIQLSRTMKYLQGVVHA